jgi:hypothetical protein
MYRGAGDCRRRWTLAVVLAALGAAGAGRAETILFVGNSFTYGATSPARPYKAGTVTDLNGEGIGGVPALFKAFADEAGLDYQVSLETAPGKGLDYHYDQKLPAIAGPWDTVILQSYSTLDAEKPGDPARLVKYAGLLAGELTQRNPQAKLYLVATWSRADLTYPPGTPWSGRPIEAMAQDVRAGYDLAKAATPAIRAVLPVGEAWTRAMHEGVADPDPYDGVSFGQVDLWGWDHYHASAHGYYLEALVIFGGVTGRDPRSLGDREASAAGPGPVTRPGPGPATHGL